jgi:DHA2 family multidrug resistance protein
MPGIPSIWNLSTSLSLAAMNATVTKQAATIAYINDFRLMMYLTLLAVPLLLLIKPPKRAAAA